MPRKLVVVGGPDQGREFPLPESDSLLLGRSRATETRLTDPRVSRVHCEVHVDGESVSVHDFDSPAGTFVNGERVASQQLWPGDVIRVGDTELRYEADAPPRPAAAASPPDVFFAARPLARPMAAPLKQLQNLVGQALGGFQVLRVLGAGHVGVVFQARDTKDNKMVALKVFKPEFAQDTKAVQRLVRGIMAGRALQHPNLVTLYNAGCTGPYWWMSLELVDGDSLADLLRRSGPGTPLSWTRALRLGVHVGRALAYAHENQLVHRNVMPENILIRGADQVAKLGDLLLARELEGAFGTGITGSRELVGNVYYLPPERTQGTTTVDSRSDLYSLGVTLYHALAGRLPFTGVNFVEVVQRIRTATPERPGKFQTSLPADFEAVVLRLLAKRPEDRPRLAVELVAQLEQVARVEGVPV
jgi:serine/threonine protein kinase